MKIVRNDIVIDALSYSYSQNVDIDVQNIDQGSIMLVATDATGAAKTFISTDVTAATNIITIAAHGFITGQKVAASTTGALPTGLSATDYYVIRVSASTFKLAASLVNALAGTEVDIAADGSGTNTLTPATLATTIKIMGSNDGTTYEDYGTALTTGAKTASFNKLFELTDKLFVNYIRVNIAVTGGILTLSARLHGRQY